MKHRATIFGISGCTNSGKTTVANQLIEKLRAKNFLVAHVCQDDFFKKPDKVKQVPCENVSGVFFYHYDEPNSVDEDGMAKNIENLAISNDLVIVEGNMLFELTKVDKFLDEIVFFTMTKEQCRERRSKRNYDPPDGPGYFDQIVWPAYELHLVNALKRKEEGREISFQSGTEPLDEIFQKIFSKLEDAFKDFIRIQNDPIITSIAESFVNLPSCGAISTFIGTTRDNFNNKSVLSLEYECYEAMAYSELKNVCVKTREKYSAVKRIAIIHRIGKVNIGQSSVVITTSSPHRKEAIEATHFAIDLLKETVPIFKKEVYSDGKTSWKENNEFGGLKNKLQSNEGCCENRV